VASLDFKNTFRGLSKILVQLNIPAKVLKKASFPTYILIQYCLSQPPLMPGVNVWLNPNNAVWQKFSGMNLQLFRIGGEEYDSSLPSSTPDWVKQIESMGAQALLQIPIKSSPQQAADLVKRYPTVKYWNIGNEPDFPGPVDVAQLSTEIKSRASAMKKINPKIKIFVPDLAWYNIPVIDALFGGAHDISGKDENGNYYADGIAWHQYPFKELQGNLRYNLTAVIEKSSKLAFEKVNAVNTQKNRTGENALQWGLGEFNGNNEQGFAVHSFDNGQFFGCTFGILMKYKATYGLAWSMYENGGNRTGTDFSLLDKQNLTPRANYWHLYMISKYFTGNYVEAQSSNSDIFTYGCRDIPKEVECAVLINRANTPKIFMLGSNLTEPANGKTLINFSEGFRGGVFTDTLPGNTTLLYVFEKTKALKWQYSELLFNSGKDPQLTSISHPFSPPVSLHNLSAKNQKLAQRKSQDPKQDLLGAQPQISPLYSLQGKILHNRPTQGLYIQAYKNQKIQIKSAIQIK